MDKFFIYFGITIGSLIGAYIPVIMFGADYLDFSSLAGGAVGSIVGLFVGFKLYQNLDL